MNNQNINNNAPKKENKTLLIIIIILAVCPVLIILGIMAAIVIPRTKAVISGAKEESFKSSVELIATGIKDEVIAGRIDSNGNCKNNVPDALEDIDYDPDNFDSCTFTVNTTTYEVSVTASGSKKGQYGKQDSYTVIK